MAIRAIREYVRLMKTPGLHPFMTKKEISEITDPVLLEAISKWKRIVKQLSVLWFTSVFVFILVAIIINRTIGFRNI